MSGSNPTSVAVRTSNGQIPQSSRSYYFNLTLTSGVAQVVDLRAQQHANVYKDSQGIFVDNSLNVYAVTISLQTGQNIVCPPYSQMTAPLYIAPSVPVLLFSGNGTIGINLLNFPTPICVWNVQGSATVSNGLLQVQDTALASLLSSDQGGSTAPTVAPTSSILVSGQYSSSVPSMGAGYTLGLSMTQQGVLKTASGGQSSALNITASTNVKASPGRIGKLVVNAAPTSTAYVIDSTGTAQSAANTVLTIPTATTIGTVFNMDFPALAGISVIPSGGTFALSYD